MTSVPSMCARTSGVDAFTDYLPRLVNAYHRGLLVPFLGAGMSVAPNDAGCPMWGGFVQKLESEAGISAESADPIRRANYATRALRRKSENALIDAAREALYANSPEATEATRQLASLWWPLVLSTNYDDLFFRAYCPRNSTRLSAPADSYRTPTEASPGPNGEVGYEMRVLGRSVEDCDRVLLSLRETGLSLLWALHGFLANDTGDLQAVDESERERWKRLTSELVIGHESYQEIAHTAVHYRRAFSEVYRQRSFLFLGSSLTDPYVLGLFAEVQELYGRSSLPHFAMVVKGETDAEFLRSRFNILCIEYDRHEDLPELLKEMTNAIELGLTRGTRWEVTAGASCDATSGALAIEHSDLPLPSASVPGTTRQAAPPREACVVFGSASDGRQAGRGSLPFSPHVGEGIREAAARTSLPNLQDPSNWQEAAALSENPDFSSVLLELKPSGGEARASHAVVTAWRTLGTSSSATRDLRQISIATQAAMTWATANGFDEVHMPLLATGRGSPITGRTALIEMVRGYACWLRNHTSGRVRLVLHLRNKAALFELTSGRTDVVEILSSPSVLRFWLEVRGAGEGTRSAGTDRELMLCPASTTLESLLSASHLSLDKWSAEVDPPPIGPLYKLDKTDHLGSRLDQIGLVPGATLRFQRNRTPASE